MFHQLNYTPLDGFVSRIGGGYGQLGVECYSRSRLKSMK